MIQDVSVKDIMTVTVITGSKTDSIKETAIKMKNYHIGVVVIIDNARRVEGLISEKDIINRVVCTGLDPEKTQVKDIMTKKIITGKPDMSDIQVASIFTKHGIKKLPIIEKNKLVGIITKTDLLKLLSIKWTL